MKMICVIKCLNEHIEYFTGSGFQDLKRYKYHSEVIMTAPFSFTLLRFVHLQIPLSLQYCETKSTTVILLNKNNILDFPVSRTTPKPINWKLQFQRHQVNKLLKITGS